MQQHRVPHVRLTLGIFVLVALAAVAVPGVRVTASGWPSLSVRLTWPPLKWSNRSAAGTSP